MQSASAKILRWLESGIFSGREEACVATSERARGRVRGQTPWGPEPRHVGAGALWRPLVEQAVKRLKSG